MKSSSIQSKIVSWPYTMLSLSLWNSYTILVIISFISALVLLYTKWTVEKNNAFNDLTFANELIHESIKNNYQLKTSLMKILGSRLVKQEAIFDSAKTKKIINDFLRDKPEITGFVLTTVDGRLISTWFKNNTAEAHNSLFEPVIWKNSGPDQYENSVVMGHSFFALIPESWILPMHYQIRDIKNRLLANMTVAFDITDENLWGRKKLSGEIELKLLGGDGYFQYDSNVQSRKSQKDYVAKADENLLAKLKEKLFNQHLAKDSVINLQFGTPGQYTQLLAASYNGEFDYYIITKLPGQVIINRWIPTAIGLILFLILFNSSLYYLFRKNQQVNAQVNKKILYQANHDQLTKLPNRYALEAEFHRWSKDYDNKFSLLFVDLNNFKTINDLHGHAVGDIILKKVARRLTSSFIECLCFRYGGDEFVILSPVISKDLLLIQCRQFHLKMKKAFFVEELEFDVNASIGISIAPFHGFSLLDLLRKSDIAMFNAKKHSNCVNFFSHQMETETKRKLTVEKELFFALKKQEFSLVYQPQYSASSRELVGLEALLRWDSQELGHVSPEEFIPIAESSGLINQIGEYVMLTAIKEGNEIGKMLENEAGNNGKRLKKIRLSINVSIQQLMNDHFLSLVKQILKQHNSLSMELMFEVTENLFINDLPKVKNVLRRLQLMGVHVSLDDFGTGYSSLNILNHLPLNELKIDKSFIFTINSNEQSRHLVQSIIDIGHNLFIPVVAEGVEYKEQARILSAMGCDIFQGFLYSSPQTKNKLIKTLKSTDTLTTGNKPKLYLIENN